MDNKENYMKEIIIRVSFFWSLFLFIYFVCEWLLQLLKKIKLIKIKIKIFHVNVLYKIICPVFPIYCIISEREWYTSEQLLYAVCSACVFTYLRQKNYSKAQINLSLKENESIGALWAHQTYNAYYKIVLENIMGRMEEFQEKHNIQFYTKKLLLVIPLSCDIEGTFTQRDATIEEFGNLEIIENDAGGNINRKFKNPVFKIRSIKDVYIVAEYSQPVATLKRSEYILKEENFRYIRDCYVKTLKSLLQGSPCIIVLHDDKNVSETLSGCILSTIQKEREQQTDFTA